MERAFYSIGALCVLYYICIALYTRNWKPTFAWFWVLSGALWGFAGLGVKSLPAFLDPVIRIVLIVIFIIFFAVEIIILSGMLTLPKKGLPVIIVLGACVRGNRITGSLKRRLDKALAYLNENPETKVIVSGGKGRGEDVTEAFAMKKYLMQQGVEEERIILEEKSKTTRENLENSRKYLKKESVGIVTNNFHMYRAVKLARYIGYEKVRGITAGSDPVLFLNYMVREFFAVLHMYLKMRGENKKAD